jgi:hypothetical protein
MTMTPSNTFQEYAWFSVQVDQYYAAIRIFARHYDALKAAYSHLPKEEDWPNDVSCLSDQAKAFFIRASSALNYMGTTQVFTDAAFPQLSELPTDIVNFGFYTCFCFQWTLFENFVKQSVMGLAAEGLLPTQVASNLQARELRTRAFLKYIDEGHVFGHTPFATVLPITGWTPQFENCNFQDLDLIREQRNRFIHAVENPSILPATEIEKERLYDRSMWILRLFAGNIYQDILNVRGQSSESAGSAQQLIQPERE